MYFTCILPTPLSVGVLQKRCCWGRRCRLLLPRHSAGSLKLWRTQKKQRHQWQRPQNGTILYIHSSSSLRLESRTSRPLFFLLLFNLEDEAAVWLYTASTHTYSTASKFWAWRAEKTYTQQLDLVRLLTHTFSVLSVWKNIYIRAIGPYTASVIFYYSTARSFWVLSSLHCRDHPRNIFLNSKRSCTIVVK